MPKKIRGNLGFHVKLEATLPDKGIGAALQILNAQAVLDKARDFIAPTLHAAIATAFAKAKLIGIEVKALESHLDLTEDDPPSKR